MVFYIAFVVYICGTINCVDNFFTMNRNSDVSVQALDLILWPNMCEIGFESPRRFDGVGMCLLET